METEYPSCSEKVLLAYVAAKCKEIKSLKVNIADVVRDFSAISEDIGLCIYGEGTLPPALETDIEYLKLHGLIKADMREHCLQLTPLGKYVSMSFSIPEEIQNVLKANYN